MKIRALLTCCAAIAIMGAAAVTVPGVAGATVEVSTDGATSPPPVSQATFASASGGVTTGPHIAGVVPARTSGIKASPGKTAGTAGTAAPAATTCTEPNCNMSYHGLPVQHSPHVYIIFWGPKWNSDTTAVTAKFYLMNLFKGLGLTSKGDGWSTVVSQYSDKTGHPTFGTALFKGARVDTLSSPPKSVTLNNLGAEAAKAVNWFGITDTTDADIIVASQPSTCFAPPAPGAPTFAGNCGIVQSAGGYCAFHEFDYASATNQHLPWVNLPFQLDAGSDCGENFINSGSAGTNDGFSITAGHEAMEVATDPYYTTTTNGGWFDVNDSLSGGEVADKCAWGGQPFGVSDPANNISLSTGTFAMQSLWSNATHSCVMNGGLSLSVTTPATQTGILGKAASLKIQASINGSTALTYKASGLPGGLSINKTTGVISGTFGITAGIFNPKVTVSYYDGWKTIGFSWHVSSLPGPVKGYGSKCVDDSFAKTTAGNKIDIWTCTGGTAQKITFTATKELQVLGKCITGTNSAFLESCVGATSQIWTRLSNGEYVLRSNGLCLTAPNATNGTRLTVVTCKNATNQHWTLP